MDTTNEAKDDFSQAFDASPDVVDPILDQSVEPENEQPEAEQIDGGGQEKTFEQLLSDSLPQDGESEEDQPEAPEATQEQEHREDLVQTDEAPKTWRKEAKAEYDKLPDTIKKEIHRREEDIHRGIAQYKNEANSWKEVVAPFVENIRASGVDERHAVKHLLSVENSLRNGDPHTKAAVLANLIKGYSIDMDLLINPNKIDPGQIQNFQRYENERMQRLNAQQQLDQINLRETDKVVNEFSKDKEFIKEAEPVMIRIIQGMSAQERAGKSHAQILDEAYQAAIWQVPAIRKTLLDRQAEQSRKQAEESNRRNRAKTAAVGVKNSSTQTVSKPASSEIEDVFAHAMDQHGL